VPPVQFGSRLEELVEWLKEFDRDHFDAGRVRSIAASVHKLTGDWVKESDPPRLPQVAKKLREASEEVLEAW
jgi:hypothetical protein